MGRNKGKDELITEAMAIKCKAELEEVKSKAVQLSNECKKALMLFDHPEASKAINLCNQFLLPATKHSQDKHSQEEKANESLRMLWEGQLYAIHSINYTILYISYCSSMLYVHIY